jgi:DNA-binding transcriptional MerR regulator
MRIREVSEAVGVPDYVLRQWEERFPQLRPKRDRRNQRVYSERDVAIARRIKELLRDERMTGDGAVRALARELAGESPPKTRQEATELLDRIEAEARALLDLLDEPAEENRDD